MWGEMGLMGNRAPSPGLEGQPGKEQTHGLLWGFHPQKVIPDHLNWSVLVFGVPHSSTHSPSPTAALGAPGLAQTRQLLGLFLTTYLPSEHTLEVQKGLYGPQLLPCGAAVPCRTAPVLVALCQHPCPCWGLAPPRIWAAFWGTQGLSDRAKSTSLQLAAPSWLHQGAEPWLCCKLLISVQGDGSDRWKTRLYFTPSFPGPPQALKKSHNYLFFLLGVSFLFPDMKTKRNPHDWVRTHHFLGEHWVGSEQDFPTRASCPPAVSPSLRRQMEGSSFLIIKISASLKSRSLLLALRITAFVREEQ